MNILYPGSFNPIHDGHLNIISKVKKLFPNDKLIIAALYNPTKVYDLPIEERRQLIRQQVPGHIIIAGNHTIDEVVNHLGIDLVIRGIRNYQDVKEDEEWLDYVQTTTSATVIYIKSDPEFLTTSSATVRC